MLDLVVRVRRDVNLTRYAVALHSRGRIDSVAPHVLGEFFHANDSGDARSGMQTDANLKGSAVLAIDLVEGLFHLQAQYHHLMRHDPPLTSTIENGLALRSSLQTTDAHVSVANGLDLFDGSLLAQRIPGNKFISQHQADQKVSIQLGTGLRKADEIGEQDGDGLEVLHDVIFATLEPLGDAPGEDVVQQLLGAVEFLVELHAEEECAQKGNGHGPTDVHNEHSHLEIAQGHRLGMVGRTEGTDGAQLVKEGTDHAQKVHAEPPLGGVRGAKQRRTEGTQEGPDHDGPAPDDAADAQLEAHGQEEDEEELDEDDLVVPSLGGEAQEAHRHEDGVGRGKCGGDGFPEGGVHEGPHQAGPAGEGAHEEECRPADQLVGRRVRRRRADGQPVPVGISDGAVGGRRGGAVAAGGIRGGIRVQDVTAGRMHQGVVNDILMRMSTLFLSAPLLGKVGIVAKVLEECLAFLQLPEGISLDLHGGRAADAVPSAGDAAARVLGKTTVDARPTPLLLAWKAAAVLPVRGGSSGHVRKGQAPGAVHASGAAQAFPGRTAAAQMMGTPEHGADAAGTFCAVRAVRRGIRSSIGPRLCQVGNLVVVAATAAQLLGRRPGRPLNPADEVEPIHRHPNSIQLCVMNVANASTVRACCIAHPIARINSTHKFCSASRVRHSALSVF